MFLRKTGIIFFCLILSASIYSQEPIAYLVSMNPGEFNTLQQNVPEIKHRYDGFQNKTIFSFSPREKNNLDYHRLPYKILDQNSGISQYYLITSISGRKIIPDPDFTILYSENNSAIVKISRFQPKVLLDAGYRFTALFTSDNRVRQKSSPVQAPTISQMDNGTDPAILSVLSYINSDSVRAYIQGLQDFKTRFLLAYTREDVVKWIYSRFMMMGFAPNEVRIDTFYYNGSLQENVIATISGTLYPEQYCVIGGHYDSYSSGNPEILAPGADDNASGTAAVLEMARAMRKSGLQPDISIQFAAFAAEEYGLLGSKDLADKAASSDQQIRLMINHDMISYSVEPPGSWRVHLNYYSGSEFYREQARELSSAYTSLVPVTGDRNSSGSDSHSYWRKGYPAFYFEEYQFSPYYHSSSDLIEYYNMDYCTEIIKASAALAIHTTEMPSAVNNIQIANNGDGTSLLVKWSPNREPDLSIYKVYVGTVSGVYTSTFTTADTSYQVEGLTDGVQYYIGVSATDNDGNESPVTEETATPHVKPFAPQQLAAFPQWHSIHLTWLPDNEEDLLGYNIYRSDNGENNFVLLNSHPVRQSSFTDNNITIGQFYFYNVTAIDSTGHESNPSGVVRSRAVSLDHGILMVDETTDGSGSELSPTDARADAFYDSVMQGISFTQYDVEEEGGIDLAEMGIYSTIIWHGNDLNDFSVPVASREDIRRYLEFGGNMLITSYLPSLAFTGVEALSKDYGPGDFMYDILKIKHIYRQQTSRFIGAASDVGEYPNLYIDTLKTPDSYDHHINSIESLQPTPDGQIIYRYDTRFDTLTAKGEMKGEPVGVEYIGGDYRVITLSFPLYNMQEGGVKRFVETVLSDKFNEPVTATGNNKELSPTNFVLQQNYPNPFNPTTRISFAVPQKAHVILRLYDVLGHELATLVNAQKEPGTYTISLDAVRLNLSSGIYVYRMQAGDYADSRKMLFLK